MEAMEAKFSLKSAAEMLDEIHSESLQHLFNELRSDAFPLGGTGIQALDECLSGPSSKPLSRGDIIEIQGPSGSGKTHLVYQLLQTCVLPVHDPFHGWGKSAVVFDTDGTFDMHRLHAFLESRISIALSEASSSREDIHPGRHAKRILDDSLSRIHIFRPTSTIQLAASISHLEQFLATDPRLQQSEMGLLVVDSISAFYWEDRFTVEQFRYGSREERLHTRNPFQHVVAALQRLRDSHSPVMILTNWALNTAHKLSPPDEGRDPPLYRQHLRPFLTFETGSEDTTDSEARVEGDHISQSTVVPDLSQGDPDHPSSHVSNIPSLSVNYHITLWSASNTAPIAPLADLNWQLAEDSSREIHVLVRATGRDESGQFCMRVGKREVTTQPQPSSVVSHGYEVGMHQNTPT